MVAGSSVLELLTMTCSDAGPRVARVRGATVTVTGQTATLIDVQATIDPAQQGFEILGAAGYATWPLRDRARAAVINSGMTWPTGGITVELSPGARFRHGCGLDLAIAVGILTADGTVPSPADTAPVFAAELGLDGQLRVVRGIVPVLVAASEHNKPVTAVIALGNQPDAAAVPGLHVAVCSRLRQVADWLSGEDGTVEHS
jgi:magnesium chelatase family protein